MLLTMMPRSNSKNKNKTNKWQNKINSKVRILVNSQNLNLLIFLIRRKRLTIDRVIFI